MRRAIAFFSMFSLLLALAVPSFATYDIQDDTSPVTAGEGSPDSLYDVATSYGSALIPTTYEWSNTDSSNLTAIRAVLGTYNNTRGTIADNVYQMQRAIGSMGSFNTSDINGKLQYIYQSLYGSYMATSDGGALGVVVRGFPASINTVVTGGSITADIPDNIGGFPQGTSLSDMFASSGSFYHWNVSYNGSSIVYKPKTAADVSAYTNNALSTILYSLSRPLRFVLSDDGTIFDNNDSSGNNKRLVLSDVLNRGQLGLAVILRGSSGSSVSGKLINYADLSETDFSANNILSMLSPLLTVQNDLARIGHVIADPQDQAIKDANKDNYKELENLSKGDAALKPSDIGDMAGVSSDLSGMLDTGVSIGDAFDQASGEGALAFFSQQTANDLDTTVQIYGSDDGFVHPDWSNWSLLEGVPLE